MTEKELWSEAVVAALRRGCDMKQATTEGAALVAHRRKLFDPPELTEPAAPDTAPSETDPA